MVENTSDLLPFLNAMGDGVYTVDPDGTCLFVNAAAMRILGYDTADELLGRNMHDLIHHTRVDGSFYPRGECPLLHAARGGGEVRLENELLWRRDGSSFLGEYSAFPAQRDGQPIGSVITFAENRVRQDARIRLSVQHAVSQVLAAPLGRMAMLTRILGTVGGGFGWEAGLFWRNNAGAAPLQLAAVWGDAEPQGAASLVDPGYITAQEWTASLALRAVSGRQAVNWSADAGTQDTLTAEAERLGMRSGFAFPVMAGLTVFGAMEFFSRADIAVDAILLEAVAVLGQMVGQAIERQQLTYTMRKSEARFRTIANAIPQLAWMTDATGATTWYNDRWYAFTGTRPAQMEGWGWISVHHPEHVDRVERTLRESFARGETWEDTFPLRAADGTYRWFLSRAEPIRADLEIDELEGAILGWFGTNTDITATSW